MRVRIMLCFWGLLYILGGASETFDAEPATSLRGYHPFPDPIHFQEEEMIESLMEDFVAALEKWYQSSLDYAAVRKFLNVVTSSSPFVVQAASMSFWAYDLDYFEDHWQAAEWAGGWKIVSKYVNTTIKSWAPGKDVVLLFRRGDECVLSFAGTTGLADWTTNLNIKSLQNLEECGLQSVHEGFFEDFVQFMLGDEWSEEMEPEIVSNCGGRLAVTGHSQGGALAEIFATCVNRVDNVTLPDLWRWGELVHPGRRVPTRVTVTGVYGFASPGSTVDYQLENTSPGGVFPGLRFFNMDEDSFDPVPWITVVLNFQHAKCQAIQLPKRVKGQECVKHAPNSYNCRWQPLTSAVFGKWISFEHHLGPEYMRRIFAFSREVSIVVVAGQNFTEECSLGGIYPYIEVQVGEDEDDQETHFTAGVDAGLLDAAYWNESFVLTTYEPGNVLQLTAWNDCTMDFEMGSVVLQSADFDPTGFAGWLSLNSGARLEIIVQIEYKQQF